MTELKRDLKVGRNFWCYFWLFFGFIAVAWGEEREQTQGEHKHVLLINSYHSGMDWTDGQVSGVRKVLEKSIPSIELHVEYMDTKRVSDETHFSNFRQSLIHKYRNTKFAAIITTDNDAFDFLRQYRDQLFSDVPVVFSGVNFFREDMLTGLNGFTGVAETFEGGQTIGEMLSVHPQVRRIVVISDNTTTGRAIRNELSPMLVPYAEKVSFDFWDYLSLDQLRFRLSKLGEDTLVLLMPFSRDGVGTFVTYPQIANLVSQSSPVPVYGTWDFYMGYGIVGGRLTNAAAQGQAAARIVLRILAGDPPSQIPVTRIAPSEFQFDARQLHRFGISPAKLPVDSKLQFQSWDEIYRNWIYAGALLAIITLLAGWGWGRNYTLKRQISMALQKSEERYRLILNHSPTGILLYDRDLIVTYCNDRFAQIINTPAEQLFGLDLNSLQNPRIILALRMAAEGDSGAYEGEYDSTLSAARCWISMSCILFGDKENKGAIAFVEDITERNNAETKLLQYRDHLEELVFSRTAELAKSRDAAEAANRAKSAFLANMSHELRTPMNGIMGMMDLARRRATDPRQIDHLNKSRIAAQHLLVVINDILDISSIEAGQVQLEDKPFSVTRIVNEAMEMQGDREKIKGLSFLREIDPALPDLLCGDAFRLRQILINFVGNAIKFSTQGLITVRASASEQDSHSVLLRIEVIDQGIGISPEIQARLFNAFTQADESMTRQYGGTGLGLRIAKRLAMLMGGDVGVVSQLARGSTFWATVRLKRVAADQLFAVAEPESSPHEMLARLFHGRRVLVVDDNPVNLAVETFLLEEVGLVPDVANNGNEALEKARGGGYALILMDLQMPVMDGLEATRAIRQLPNMADTPILAMTANAFDEDRDGCLAAGMNAHIDQPMEPDTFYTTVLLWMLNSADPAPSG